MRYTDLNVSFRKPDIWKKPTKDTFYKEKAYADIIAEMQDLDKLKKDIKEEINKNVDMCTNLSQSKGELSNNMSDMFDHFGRSVIMTDDFEEKYLLGKTNKNTLAKKLQPWCGNLVFNIQRVIESPPLANLFGKFKGKPAFVVLAGPSLKNNIEELKKVGDKGIVIATDTAFRPCLEAGIKVHLVMAHDANPQGMRFFLPKDHPYQNANIHFNDMPFPQLMQEVLPQLKMDEKRREYKYDTIGVFVNYCHPLTIEAFNGSELCFYQVLDPSLPVYALMGGTTNWRREDDKFLPEIKGSIVGGSSVGHTSTYLAVNLGCDPITIIGCDLSYPGGLTYVPGASNQKDASKQKLIMVRDLSGREVGTNLSMFSYRMVFQKSLPAIIEQTGIKFFNSTEHEDGSPAGILEVGAEPKRLKDVINEYCKEDYEDIKNMKELLKTKKKVIEDVGKLKK